VNDLHVELCGKEQGDGNGANLDGLEMRISLDKALLTSLNTLKRLVWWRSFWSYRVAFDGFSFL
jgi:hypothetical protein